MTAWDKTFADGIRARLARGETVSDIARDLGVGEAAIYNGVKRHGISPGRVSVPAWVPAWMRGEYRENAALYGENAAARYARRDKAEAQ